MKIYKATLKGISPYSQSRYHDTPKLPREGAADYEKRTWRNRMHVDTNGIVYIPPMALKNCLGEAAKYLNVKIPGQGNNTYTKHFEAGTLVCAPMPLGVKAEDVPGEWFFVPAKGVRGDGPRVYKCFGYIMPWSVEAEIHVLDETITYDVLHSQLVAAGSFIGLGRFRPRRNGFYGRFEVVSLKEAA